MKHFFLVQFHHQVSKGQVIQVDAEVHALPLDPVQNKTDAVLEFPIENEDGIQQTITLPDCFDDQPKDVSDGIDFDNISLGEVQVEDLPSELWTSDLESLFLSQGGTCSSDSYQKEIICYLQ